MIYFAFDISLEMIFCFESENLSTMAVEMEYAKYIS